MGWGSKEGSIVDKYTDLSDELMRTRKLIILRLNLENI
jgi:hypothetical protein